MSKLYTRETTVWVIPSLNVDELYKIKFLYFRSYHPYGFVHDLHANYTVLDGWLIENPDGDIFLKHFLKPQKTISFSEYVERGGDILRESQIVKRKNIANFGFIYSVYIDPENNQDVFDVVFLRS